MREMTVLILVVGREKLLNRTCSSRCTCYFHPGQGGGVWGDSLLWPVQGDSAERPSIFLRLKVF